MFRQVKPTVKLHCAIALGAAMLLLAACGGSSSAHSAATPSGQNAARALGPTTTAQAQLDLVTGGVTAHRPGHGTGGAEPNDGNPGGADRAGQPATGQSDPCKLLSRAEAQAVLGRPINTPVEAPLGPTCVYRPIGAKSFVTLTIESIDLAKAMPRGRNRTRVDVAGTGAACPGPPAPGSRRCRS